ncbi:hypothetical protein [Chitinophaga sp. RAB17]|uniref:hypothetical protein n=1 Tax=Chitinophaga sp. RAB17 TaxID=3233049 RepID=UPI003F8F5001
MVQNVITKSILLLLIILFTCKIGFSQKVKTVDNATTDKFLSQVEKEYVSHGIPDSDICSDYTTIIFHVRGNKFVDPIEYTRSPKVLKTSFAGAVKFYKKANWKKIIPGSGANFDLVQPMVYEYDHHKLCPDSIPFVKIKDMTNEDLNTRKDTTVCTFVLKVLKAKKFEEVH